MVRKKVGLCYPNVASKTFENPDEAASFQIQRSTVSLRIHCSTTDVPDRVYWAIRLFLIESGAITIITARVAVHAGWSGAVGASVPHGEKTKMGGIASVARIFTHTIFSMAGVNENSSPFRRREAISQAEPHG